MLIFINHLLLYVGGDGLAVPPLWSGFPDFGPDPDFFVQPGPETVRICGQSPDFFLLCMCKPPIVCLCPFLLAT